MLLFVFVVATLNLAVGYALGAGLTLGTLLDLLPMRRSPKPAADLDEEPLTRPATALPAQAAPPAIVAPAKLTPTDVVASLAGFREQLAAASVELRLTQADPARFQESAAKLQHANHSFLASAQVAIQDLGDAGDRVSLAAKKEVARGASRFAEVSGEIDGILLAGVHSDDAQQAILGCAERARDVVAAAETASVGAIAAAESPPAARTDSFQSLDALFDHLESLLADAGDDAVRHVAAIRVDPIPGREDDHKLNEAVENHVRKLARESLAEGQLFVPGRPAMALLTGDSLDDAAERLEKVRQQVEATLFESPDGDFRATVTCALTDARPGDNRKAVVDQVNLALDESVRTGANRTYHHDGAFPTALAEGAVAVTPCTVSL